MSDVRLDPATVLRHRSGVLFRELEGEAVLLDLDAGTYFGLNEVGTRAWALIGEGVALGGVQEVLLREYEVAPDQLWDDLVALVGELLEHRLVEAAL
jgi:hypothetical protein